MSFSQDVSSGFMEQLRACRETLTSESKRLGGELAKRLAEAYRKMEAGPPFHGTGIALNQATLLRATVSFWEDILRVKAYHPIEQADRYKKAAYIFKWIAKMRPVKPVVDHPNDIRPQDMNANAIFAVLCACGYLGLDTAVIPEEEFKRLRYSATYREINADEWATIFFQLKKLCLIRRYSIDRINKFLSTNTTIGQQDRGELFKQLEGLAPDTLKDLLLKLLDLGFENEPKALQIIQKSLSG
jgi:hypothetical protein